MTSQSIWNEDGGLRIRNESSAEAKQAVKSAGKPQSGSFFGLEWDRPGSSSPWPSFDQFPEHLRVGPWSPLAYIFLAAFISFVAFSAGWAFADLPKLTAAEPEGSFIQLVHGAGALYMTTVLTFTLKSTGLWPFVSYTAISYVLMTLRFTFVFLGCRTAAEILRFPVVAMATVTSTIWWLVLFPVILAFAAPKNRRAFLKMNLSWFLFNMHLLNLPIALASQWSHTRPLVFLDFWVASILAACYLFFYLLVMDPNGLHLYIILSPRPWWCIISYLGILLLYAQLFHVFGS
ncbi:unnamed protein product [Symbiodinium pilosum]|uniref:Uncharacterized protein n=1 Tax=Symbiodinium pilosum TaxID=2952 RepID=A0A812S8U9_SYMPI|nr:unnamed protein product [Symbiodinium pilosum]